MKVICVINNNNEYIRNNESFAKRIGASFVE